MLRPRLRCPRRPERLRLRIRPHRPPRRAARPRRHRAALRLSRRGRRGDREGTISRSALSSIHSLWITQATRRRTPHGRWKRATLGIQQGVGRRVRDAPAGRPDAEPVVALSAPGRELARIRRVALALDRCHHLPKGSSPSRDRLEQPTTHDLDALRCGRCRPVCVHTAKQVREALHRHLPALASDLGRRRPNHCRRRRARRRGVRVGHTWTELHRASNEPTARSDRL